MPVVTRSQTNSKICTRSSVRNVVELQPKKRNVVRKRSVVSRPERPQSPEPQVTFLTQEEFDASNYDKRHNNGYVNGLLTAINILEVNKIDPEDWIKYECYTPKNYVRPDNYIYVVAPDGYYWELRHAIFAGHYYDLDKISNLNKSGCYI